MAERVSGSSTSWSACPSQRSRTVRSLLLTKIRTAVSLGVGNIARVADYRLRLHAGMHPVQRIPVAAPPRGPFFDAASTASPLAPPRARPGTGSYFGWLTPLDDGRPPDWHRNVLTGMRFERTDAAWWKIPDFDASAGDIKGIWEASRFDWVVALAQHAASRDDGSLDQLNLWLQDWCARNPPYRGHNWKCGQEASIRVMHLAVAGLVLGQTASPRPALLDLLELHLRRIAPTIRYAVGQDNNHGTSEAAALFIGGSWLAKLGRPFGGEWEQLGRNLLANRAARLIEADGTFSQYSVNYQRLLLDTLSLAEVWRRHLELPPFAGIVNERAAVAAEWLRAMVDPISGDAPNLGANDSTNLLPLTDAGNRDYRPAVHLAAVLFENRAAYPLAGACEQHIRWLGLGRPAHTAPVPRSKLFDDGGFAVMRRENATVLLRYPRFRFRPSHADALHVDLWVAGENLLRDGGSYSYAADMDWQQYFGGARGHNSVQFDDRQQMPRLGRFLWGDWLRTSSLAPIEQRAASVSMAASYGDAEGATHARRVELHDSMLRVSDAVAGFSRRAVLRWRLRPGPWRVSGHEATNGTHRIVISSSVAISRFALVDGWESRYYAQKTEVPVLEVEIGSPGALVTEYSWDR
jgi:hypothetical protein